MSKVIVYVLYVLSVMLSLGLLYLLLVSSCLPVLSTPPGTPLSTSPDDGQLEPESHENQKKLKKLFTWVKKNPRMIAEVLFSSLSFVPGISGLNKIVEKLPHADPLQSKLKALDVKLDIFHAEMKWDAWAAGAYQTPVNNIEIAWIKYTELVRSYLQTTNTEKEALKKDFFTFYSQYADSTLVLHQLLTAKPLSIAQNFGDLLADRLRCHEKDVKAQFLYLNELMCKGNMLNEKYYEFKGTSTKAKVNTAHKIASQSASALIMSHQRCLSDSTAYIKMDIFERIDDTKKHEEIADSIKEFLVKTYDRYDWMVVAFTTHYSRHLPKIVKRHTLSGFIQVERGTVTVAVAKQVKGQHTAAAAVKRAITKCIPSKTIFCLDVAEKLKECQEKVFGKRLSQTYTAVHAFKRKSHTSTSAVKAPDTEYMDSALPESSVSLKDDSSLTPYLFTGECGNILGDFMVLIKSDVEIKGDNPCTKVKCQHNGKCVVVSGTFIAMCKCQYPHYGEHCEMSLESYKRQLQQDTEGRTQTPERFLKAMSVPPANRRSRQGTPGRSAQVQPLQPTPEHSANRRSQQVAQRRPMNRRSSQDTQRRSTRERANSGFPQRTAGSSAKGRDNIKSYCGSLCEDKNH